MEHLDVLTEEERQKAAEAVEAFERELRERSVDDAMQVESQEASSDEDDEHESANGSTRPSIRQTSLMMTEEVEEDIEEIVQQDEDGSIRWLPYPGSVLLLHLLHTNVVHYMFVLYCIGNNMNVGKLLRLESTPGQCTISSLREALYILTNQEPPLGLSESQCRGLLGFMVFADTALCFIVYTTLYCIQVDHKCIRAGFWVCIAFYPLAPFISLLCEATVVVFPLSKLGRAAAGTYMR